MIAFATQPGNRFVSFYKSSSSSSSSTIPLLMQCSLCVRTRCCLVCVCVRVCSRCCLVVATRVSVNVIVSVSLCVRTRCCIVCVYSCGLVVASCVASLLPRVFV